MDGGKALKAAAATSLIALTAYLGLHGATKPPEARNIVPAAKLTAPGLQVRQASAAEVSWTIRTVTAYTSRPEETDDTPCIAADGSDICERAAAGETICAANFVPFGTMLAIDTSDRPDGDDAITCVVADRMGSRTPNSVDLYMQQDLTRAINFGRQKLYVRTIE